MRSRSCNILHSCRVCFASTSGRLGVGISRCKHYLVLKCGRLGKMLGHEVCSRCFCVVEFARVCLLRWRNFRKTRYGIVRPWYTSVAFVTVCDLTYSARGDDTCQVILWNVNRFVRNTRVISKQIDSGICIDAVKFLPSDMDCYYAKFYPRREYLIWNNNKQTNSSNSLRNSFLTWSIVWCLKYLIVDRYNFNWL